MRFEQPKNSSDARFNEMIKLYGLAKDFKRRDQEGTAPLKRPCCQLRICRVMLTIKLTGPS